MKTEYREVCGVHGFLTQSEPKGDSGLYRKREWVSTARYDSCPEPEPEEYEPTVRVALRFDDACGNGHNSFSITAEVGAGQGFCCDWGVLRDRFPELAHLIKWHGFGPSGPLHYLANTTYLAGDRDCWGLRKGESRQILSGGVAPVWVLKQVDQHGCPSDLPKYVNSHVQPSAKAIMEYHPFMQVGEGKERELDAARQAAAWPEATDAELSVDKPQLEAALKARLPALVAEFKAGMDSIFGDR